MRGPIRSCRRVGNDETRANSSEDPFDSNYSTLPKETHLIAIYATRLELIPLVDVRDDGDVERSHRTEGENLS